MRPLSPSTRAARGSASQNATPVKSILKAASVLEPLKRPLQGDSDAVEALQSPNKKRKVLFDDVQNITHEIEHRSMDNVKLEVRTALEDHLRGNDDQYEMLKKIFIDDKESLSRPSVGEKGDKIKVKPHKLQVYVMALASCVPLLKGRQCNCLVHEILECSWLGRDDAFYKSFMHFLAALVSAKSSYLATVLAMIVDKFRLTHQSSWCVPDFPDVSRHVMRQRLHFTLQYLLQLFPSAVGILEDLLNAKFPVAKDSVQIYMAYINNLFRVKEYVPDLKEDILDIILNHVIKIDAQMQLDLDDLDDDVTAAVHLALSQTSHGTSDWEHDDDKTTPVQLHLDQTSDLDQTAHLSQLSQFSNLMSDWDYGDDHESENESADPDNLDFDDPLSRIKAVKENVEKMDAVLDTLFEFYTPFFLNPGSDKAFDAFIILLREFDQMVLPTYKSRHTQFLVFHFAQQHERLTDAFCGQLIATAFHNNTTNILKQAAAAYLASFVARAAHVPSSLVRSIFILLLHHIEQLRRKYEPICRGPDLKRFHPYYSLVQAVLYIFCFRWKDLVVAAPDVIDTDDVTSYIGQNLEWVGTSRKDLSVQVFGKLNPLKVCAQVIVEQFAKLAHRLNFMYVYPLVESNKRVRLSQFLSSTYGTSSALRDAGFDGRQESFHQLDSYFPFDPYQLPVSKRWLDSDYVLWKPIPGLNAEQDSDDSDDGDDGGVDDEDGLDEATATDSDGDDL